MKRHSLWLATTLLACSVFAGCRSTQERLRELLVDGFATEAGWASGLCNAQVQALANVSVTAVTTSGTSTAGSGTATVSGTPVMYAGAPASGPCSGTIAFTYRAVTTGTRTTWSRGRRRVSRSTALEIEGLTVTSRAGTAAGMVPAGAPGAPPGAAPGMYPSAGAPAAPGVAPGAPMPIAPAGAGAGVCAQMQACCMGMSRMPGMASMAQSCEQMQMLSTLGAQGEAACAQSLSAFRQSAAALPNPPPECR